MKQRQLTLGVIGASMLGLALHADAAFINFDSHASTTAVSGAPGAAATVTNDYFALGVVFGLAGVSTGVAVVNNSSANSSPNGACGLNAAGSIPTSCAGDIHFSFVNPANGTTPASTNLLSFVLGDLGGDIDSWLIHIYDSADVQLEARAVSSAANILQSFNYAQMSRVWIEWTAGTTAGYMLDDITFNTPTTNGVPEPGTVVLAGVALAGLGLARRRKA